MWSSIISVAPSLITKGTKENSLRCVHQAGKDPELVKREVKDIGVNLWDLCICHIFNKWALNEMRKMS